MENVALLTPFGQLAYGVILLILVMSGIYYWWRRLGEWLKRPKPLHKMSDAELRKHLNGLQHPAAVAERMRQLHLTVGNSSLILHAVADEVLPEFVASRYPTVDPEARAVIRAASLSIARILHPGDLARSLGSAERVFIIEELQQISDALPPTDDKTAIGLTLELLRSTEKLHKFEKERGIIS